ncbi:TonB-dependent receptor [Telluria aromaticivorans]|uniref:TonB-dependent receptor n=1 Tax=Telluria aromaticivorans TaxID=2725995 RepID=A0A7Y2K0H2_9BURK|nr:TonB-dependent receptor [Telluria aromaticivorans]NNG24375.1 TonB-dependent receptor [Telluria aromaticivorans]
MKRTSSGRAMASSCQLFALRATVAALAGAGLISSATVGAQELAAVEAPAVPAPAAEADGKGSGKESIVLVTGTRQAAQSAQTIKRNAEQVVDSIVADDIGKFPDKNVAEILGRVPGVQVIRQNGEAGNVVIRGLGGITTLYNGREMFTAAGRSLFLADVPVAMLQRVDVYKSQGADMVEGGTSGVIDVRTNRPFDFKGAQAAFNARAEHRDKADKIDPNVSGMLSNRWSTGIGEIGVLGGLSYQRGRYHDETAFVGAPMTIDRGIIGADAMGRVMGSGDRERLAGNLSAQWRPSKELEVYAEGFSTRIDHDSQSIFFVGGLPINNSASTVTPRAGTNYLESISNPNVNTFTLSSTQARRDDSETHQGAVGAIWKVMPGVRASTELVRTVSKYSQLNPILDTVRDVAKPISASVRDGGGFLTYPGVDMTDPAPWTLFALFDNHNRSRGAATDWRGDVSWMPESDGFIKEVSAGARVAERFASYVHELNGYSDAPNRFTPNAIKVTSIPGLNCTSPETGGNYGMNQFYAPCRDFLLDHTGAVRQAIRGETNARPDDPLSYYADREKTHAIYAKLNFGFDAGPVPVDGTIGARYVKTKQNISGFSSNNGVVSPTTVSSSTSDVLPSLSMRAHFRQDLIGRLSASKAIERAPFGDFNPGLVLFPSTTTTLATGTAGNPNLKPQEARNVDVALEWYFAPAGSVTGTLFHHKYENYLRRTSRPETFDGVTYNVSRPYNAVSGNLKGAEFAYQQFFTFLPGWLGGLGVQTNVTFMDGGLAEADGTINTFAGMSRRSANLVGLYEYGKWSGRLAYSWRDKFTAEYNYRALPYNIVVDPLKTLDASISYKLTDNVSITLDGSNLLDQAYHDYHSVPELPRDIRRYDRVVGLSLRWRN